ncbi:MAG: pseudouridine synthase [Chloroherpetonaceae bacterium]
MEKKIDSSGVIKAKKHYEEKSGASRSESSHNKKTRFTRSSTESFAQSRAKISLKKSSPRAQQNKEDQLTRLNKVIADSGITSRRNADDLIQQGVVKVNGKTVTTLGFRVSPDDEISVNGNPIPQNIKKIYIVLNKPKDYIVSVKDESNRQTVMDLIKLKSRIFPVGRLDRNTTGVLLMTNDGDLSHRLLHPSYEIEKTYAALLDRNLLEKDAKAILAGIEIEGSKANVSELFIDPNNTRKVYLTLNEGKNHEVKLLFEMLGYKVKQLDRKAFANITASRLPKGDWRFLTKHEVFQLKKMVGLF